MVGIPLTSLSSPYLYTCSKPEPYAVVFFGVRIVDIGVNVTITVKCSFYIYSSE